MKIKVVTIITRMDMGGAQKVVLDLCKALDRRLFVQVVITGEGGLLLGDLRSIPDIRHYVVPELTRRVGIQALCTDLKTVLKIRRILLEEKPDIIHTHTPKAGILGRWAAWLAGIPVIVHTYHGFGFGESHPVWKRALFVWAERATSKISTFLVTVSEQSREMGRSYGFLQDHNSRTIRAGVDFSPFLQNPAVNAAPKKLELGLPPSCMVVGIVAGFKPPKSLHDFIEVARQVSTLRPDTKFLMVGDGELRPQLDQQIRQLKLEGAVMITGWRNDIPALLRVMDVFLLTSQWEGSPLVLVEASLAGIPVVATRVDGIAEIVKNGENGFLVAARDVNEMVQKVLLLLDHESLRKEMGEKGRPLVGEFSAEKMVRDYESLYDDLIRHNLPK